MTRIHADIDALKEFHGALSRFRSAQRDIADRVDAEIELVNASLEAKASRCRSLLEQCRAELEDCRRQAAAEQDIPVDCSSSARAVSETEERLERILLWQYRIGQEASEFNDASGRFRSLLENDLPRAESEVLAAIESLEAARRIQGADS